MLKPVMAGLVPLTLLATQPAAAAPEAYTLDSEHTHIVWRVDRFGFTETVGTFVELEGALHLDETDPASSSVSATIALSGLRSDLPQREEIVRGPYWLNAESHPVIRFESTEVALTPGEDCPTQCAHVSGTLSLAGVSGPVTLKVTLNKIGTDPVTKKKAAGFSAAGQFDRSAFGIETALGPIGDTVRFEIEALAIAADDLPAQ